MIQTINGFIAFTLLRINAYRFELSALNFELLYSAIPACRQAGAIPVRRSLGVGGRNPCLPQAGAMVVGGKLHLHQRPPDQFLGDPTGFSLRSLWKYAI
jgi:hypothetical protein